MSCGSTWEVEGRKRRVGLAALLGGTIMAVAVALAIWFAAIYLVGAPRARAIQALRARGAAVVYEHEEDRRRWRSLDVHVGEVGVAKALEERPWGGGIGPAPWFTRFLPAEYFCSVHTVEFPARLVAGGPPGADDTALAHLESLPEVRWLNLPLQPITDSGL